MSSSEEPDRVQGVRAGRPPPFLTKTHQMVEDPCTSSIISWSSSGTSFIIWDHLNFSKDILPQYFRHSNFSSFIYQLNNYGFRKIGLRQYEYENKWFQAGKQHLLINIKRRSQSPSVTERTHSLKRSLNTEMSQVEAELTNLRSNVSMMKSELGSLKKRIEDFKGHFNQSEQRMRETETETQKLLEFLAKTCSFSFAQQITQHVEEGEELEGNQVMQETRLVLDQRDEIPPKNMDKMENGIHSQSQTRQDQKLEGASAENFDARITWKKLLEMREEGALGREDEAELQEQAEYQSKITHMELDDLMASNMVVEMEDAIGKGPNFVMDDEVAFELWG